MTKKKLLPVILSFLILLAAFSAAAAIAAKKPAAVSGHFYQKIIDRVDFAVENTRFELVKDGEGAEEFILNLTLTAKKTEADFYAVIKDIQIEGMDYDSLEISDLSGVGGFSGREIVLPAENGETKEVKLLITLKFTCAGTEQISPALCVNYISGITRNTADEHYLSVPLEISF